MRNFMKETTYIVLCSISMMFGDANEIKLLNTKCKTGCNKMFLLSTPINKVELPAQKEMSLHMKSCTPEVKTTYMFRRKYAAILKPQFGIRPIYVTTENIIPSKPEAEEWIKRNKCQIGVLCPPNGDCWGSTTDLCRSEKTNDWVGNRDFQYEGQTWTASFHQTCTMDWSCSMKTQMQKIILNEMGDPITFINDKATPLDEYAPNQFFIEKGFAAYIHDRIRCTTEEVKAMCFSNSQHIYCEHKLNTEESVYVTLDINKQCTYWGHSSYCLVPPNKVFADDETQSTPSMKDLKEVASSIQAIDKILNKNFFILKNDIFDIHKKINDMISNLLKLDPKLLGNMLGRTLYSRRITNEIVEVCPCEEEMSCKDREYHEPNINFCPPNSLNIPNITIFSNTQQLQELHSVKYDLVGTDVNVVLDHLEQSMYADHKTMSDTSSSTTEAIYEYFNPWHSILEYSGLAALILSLYNVLILRRQ